MGRALLIIVLGLSTIVSTMVMSLNRRTMESVESYTDHFKHTMARNCATSGAYMSLTRLTQDSSWRAGYSNKTLQNGYFSVDIQDHTENPSLSIMEVKVLSTGTYDDITKTVEVLVGIPPNLEDLAIFCTDTIENVTIYDESHTVDPSLAIQNAPEMLPFDKAGLVSLASAQGHITAGDFTPADGYPNNSFYYNAGTLTPNVTHVQGDFTLGGGRSVYGIYVVEGIAVLDGSARLEGVLYLPNPGSIVIHGGGDPKESSVTGGIFANGYINGFGNHISVQYDSNYMSIFGQFQLNKDMYIISWTESPNL